MPAPVHRRTFDAFLSHAHVDRAFVDDLYRWLGETAGLSIWYDAYQMAGGDSIRLALQRGVEASRGVLLVASPDALASGWVRTELEVAGVEGGDSPDFRVVPIRIGTADVAGVYKGKSWIPAAEAKLDLELAAGVLRAFYPGDRRADPRNSRDVFVSGSWRDTDNGSVQAVCRTLAANGLRIIGDAKDKRTFKGSDVQSIIASTGAFVGVIPFRDGVATAAATEKPYKYFLSELDCAAEKGLPSVVIADPRIRRTDGDDSAWLRMETDAGTCPADVLTALAGVYDRWIEPLSPHDIFFATDLSSPAAARNSHVRQMIERVTGMRTIVGTEIDAPDLQTAIMEAIQRAFLVIADLTGPDDSRFNVDVCIEAAFALAAGANVALMARGLPRSPPFMLRRSGQLTTYTNEVDQLGAIHKIVRKYRRRIVNLELPD